MILVDTTVWVDHLRSRDDVLARLLEAGSVLTHPFVIGEIALGNLAQRRIVLNALSGLPSAKVATDAEVSEFVERQTLFGRGVGWVDVHLLAAARLTAGSRFWTRDKRLREIAARLNVDFVSSH